MRQFSFCMGSPVELTACLEEFRRACPKAYKSILCTIFTDCQDSGQLQRIAAQVEKYVPDAVVAGLTGGGGIWQGKRCEQHTILNFMVFVRTEVRLQALDCRKIDMKAGSLQLLAACRKIPALAAVGLFATLQNIESGPVFHALSELPRRVRIFGGGATRQGATGAGKVFSDGMVLMQGLLAVCFSGPDLHVHVDSNLGWKPLGHNLVITAMGESEHVVRELNHRPAIRVYKKYLNLMPHKDFLKKTLAFPFILYRNGQPIARHPVAACENGSLVFAGDFRPEEKIRLSYGDPKEILQNACNSRWEIQNFAPQGMLLFSCIGRYIFLQDKVDQELAEYQSIAPQGGIYTYGEISRMDGQVENLNITLLSVSFREGPKPEAAPLPRPPMPSADEMSMMQRMAYFVTVTTAELAAVNRKLTRLAKMDALTELCNRGEIETVLADQIRHFHEKQMPLSVIMLDLDDFKKINDTYGHSIGDTALKFVAHVLAENLRYYDTAGRWGGEEFLVVLPGSDLLSAVAAAERLRSRIATQWTLPDGQHISASFGVCEARAGEAYAEFYPRLDKTLYAAKHHGKNRVQY